MSGSGVVRWNARKVVDQVADTIERNMEDAVHLVYVDARHRLLAIREPEFGAKYRKFLALYRLKAIVRRESRAIEGAVGMPPGKEGSYYGFYIETGSKTAPAHPWLRPALMTNLRDVMWIIAGG